MCVNERNCTFSEQNSWVDSLELLFVISYYLFSKTQHNRLNELGYDLGQIAMVTMTILEIKDQRRESARDSQGLGAFFSSGMNFGDLISGAAEATGGGLLKMNDVLKSGSVGVVGGAIGAVTSVASETGKMSLRATSAATNAVASTGKATTDAVTGVVVGTGTLIRRSGAKLGRLLNLQGKHQTDKKRIVAAEAASRARANQINSDQNAKGRLVEEKISAMVAAMDEDVVRSIMDSAEFSTDFSDSDDDMDDARAMVTGATLDSTVKRRPPNPSLPNAKPPRPVQQ
jgi:hypothetical protein